VLDVHTAEVKKIALRINSTSIKLKSVVSNLLCAKKVRKAVWLIL